MKSPRGSSGVDEMFLLNGVGRMQDVQKKQVVQYGNVLIIFSISVSGPEQLLL